MQGEWIALIGTALAGGLGAAGVIATTWTNRRQTDKDRKLRETQADKQLGHQEAQTSIDRRRATYVEFLGAGARARDELTATWRVAHSAEPEDETLRARVHQIKALTDKVREYGARLSVEGPLPLVQSGRHAEESLVTFRRFLEELVGRGVDLRGTPSGFIMRSFPDEVQEKLRLGDQLNARAHRDIDRFAASARDVITPRLKDSATTLTDQGVPVSYDLELAWLIQQLCRTLHISRSDLDTTRPLGELPGIDSLTLVHLLSNGRHSSIFDDANRLPLGEMMLLSIEDIARYVARVKQ